MPSTASQASAGATRGNTAGNITNGGFVAEQDGWIYYLSYGGQIYRIRADGTGRQLFG